MSASDPEILRLREHVHQLRGEVLAHGLILTDHSRRLDEAEPALEKLERAAMLAQAMAKQARGDRELVLSVAQKLGAAAVGAVVIADVLLRVTGH